jgi:FeS assembly SUF system protein
MNEKLNFFQIETEMVRVLKDVYDPEIPVNIYDLGLIYEINLDDEQIANITMTLTSPNCPAADMILDDINTGLKKIDGVKDVKINLTFDPPWDKSMLSEEARLELGFM